MKIREALKYGINQLKNISDSAHLDADILLLHALSNPDKSTIWLNNNLDIPLKNEEIELYESYIKRRAEQEPVAYITNKKFFYGLEFIVNKNVLIPRPESELIVNEAYNLLKSFQNKKYLIIDVGTGSGAIIISLVKNLLANQQTKNHHFMALDISAAAIDVAKLNANKHNVEPYINFLTGEYLKPLTQIKNETDSMLIIANLPYIEKHEYDNDKALQHEPSQALISGNAGLTHYQELIKQIFDIKKQFNNIFLIIEHHDYQFDQICNLIHNHSETVNINAILDFNGKKRVSLINICST